MAVSELLKMRNIHKKFPGVYALRGANLDVEAGEVHALLGENGAGKSTLIKVLGGIYEKDEGAITIGGNNVSINSVADAKKNGISIIHQELVLVPYLSIMENIFLGREERGKSGFGKIGFIDKDSMNAQTQKALDSFNIKLSPETLVKNLTIAQQQMVEIIKATAVNAKIIVMDEPTSSLSDNEVEILFETIRNLKDNGIGIIYISHRMSELLLIADRVTVMRDGECIGTKIVKDTTNEELITMMVGRELKNYYTRSFNDCKETVLKVDDLFSQKVHEVSFELKKGEILGFAGLVGAGRSETMKAIFGIDKISYGDVFLSGESIRGMSTKNIIEKGICLVPEDRKAEGIFPELSVSFNITLKVLKDFIRGVFVKTEKEEKIFTDCVKNLNVKVPDEATPMRSLSGGNQQKAIIGSWLASRPKVLILDEPTRGIDVGAKSEIYNIMNNLAKDGVAIIMVSSELPEILNMSDRIVVMCEGTVTTIMDHTEATQEKIMQYAVAY